MYMNIINNIDVYMSYDFSFLILLYYIYIFIFILGFQVALKIHLEVEM